MLSKALAAARVPPRFVWGSDPRDVAEAVLAVALEAAAQEGFEVPDQVKGEEGLRHVISDLFSALQKLATNFNEGGAGSSGDRPSSRGGAPSAGRGGMAVDVKPVNDFERAMQGAAPLGAPVLLNLASSRGKNADRESWANRVASAGETSPATRPWTASASLWPTASPVRASVLNSTPPWPLR